MSIFASIALLEEKGELVAFLPPVGWPVKRRLYLTARLCRQLQDRRSSLHFFDQVVLIRVMFEHWTSGGRIVVRLGHGKGDAELARLEPPPEEIWEFRITRSQPQVRVFGRFAAPDVFVVTAAHDRNRLGRAKDRDRSRSNAWSEAMYDCLSEWTRLFGGTPPFRGRGASDYVKENHPGPK